MNVKEILKEWNAFLNNNMLNEISLKRFSEQYPQFDTSQFTSQMKGNTDYLDIISNSINAGQNHGPDDYVQQFEFYKNSIEPNRNSQDFLTIQIPGDEPISLEDKVNQGSCKATYDDIQQFQQARLYVLGKGSKNKLNDAYQSVIDEANEEDFEKVAENSEWIIYYPKSLRGSVALARSYWDGSKVTYDNTFNGSTGYGQNVGEMKWCTSVSGSGNMFLNYHRKRNLHMYYCINKRLNISEPNRKLCISFSKKESEVEFDTGHSSVNSNNKPVSKENMMRFLGNLFNVLKKDVAQEKRLEVDMEGYYSSISLEQYIAMRRANEENIEDFINEFEEILNYSKDASKILKYSRNESSIKLKRIIAGNEGTDAETLAHLFKREKDDIVMQKIAYNRNTPADILKALSKSKDKVVIEYISRNPNTPADALEILSKSEESKIRYEVSRHINVDQNTLIQLAKDSDIFTVVSAAGNSNMPANTLAALSKSENTRIRKSVAGNKNTPKDILKYLSKDPDFSVVIAVAGNSNTSEDTLVVLSKSEEFDVRIKVAGNSNTPEDTLAVLSKSEDNRIKIAISRNKAAPSDVLKYLSKDSNVVVLAGIAANSNTSEDTLTYLSKNKINRVRAGVARNISTPKSILRDFASNKDEDTYVRKLSSETLQKIDESTLKLYIKLLLN